MHSGEHRQRLASLSHNYFLGGCLAHHTGRFFMQFLNADRFHTWSLGVLASAVNTTLPLTQGRRIRFPETIEVLQCLRATWRRSSPSLPTKEEEGQGEELCFVGSPLSSILSPLVPRGERKNHGTFASILMRLPWTLTPTLLTPACRSMMPPILCLPGPLFQREDKR